ncbi:Cdc6/Cdc18 family protein [Thermofilum pendens]|uniref:ORC1-type DNA replication protein n=1 Tax=Thermofilum pendens (strain DSM 2475 / Hrk 5) TaxID=368408 RepID=A1RXR1_THEPD|nr:ORC1-type DNA replication protein [Thermofilum pendens]ABL77991.1 ORC complex protein Cdc6/Orc1 [Thermofilum pendens Hrk 5]
MSLEEIFDQYLGSRIYKAREKLLPDYVPEDLPHRDEQIKRLALTLAPALSGSRPSNVFIYGLTGTGKTAVTKYVLRRLAEKGGGRIEYVYINCRQNNTSYRVLAELGKFLGVKIPFTGLALGEVMKRITQALDRKHRILIVVLDEVDNLVKRNGDDVLYYLTRVNEQLTNTRVSVIGITNDLKFTEFLDARVKSSLGEEELVFPPYNAIQLEDILRRRAKEAFHEGVVSDAVIKKVAAIAARQNGDCRLALDILLKAADIAERERASEVTEAHVDKARNEIEKNLTVDVIKTMPLHVKLVLASIYLLTKEGGAKTITTGLIYDKYKELVTKVGIEPVTSRRITDILNELDMAGIINARVISLGRYGRTKVVALGVPLKNVEEGLLSDIVISAVIGG